MSKKILSLIGAAILLIYLLSGAKTSLSAEKQEKALVVVTYYDNSSQDGGEIGEEGLTVEFEERKHWIRGNINIFLRVPMPYEGSDKTPFSVEGGYIFYVGHMKEEYTIYGINIFYNSKQ